MSGIIGNPLQRAGAAVRSIAATISVAAPRRRGVALRAMLCIAIPLLIGYAAGNSAAGALASFGGLAGLYVPEAPFRYRAKVVAGVGLGLTLSVFLGGLAASLGWVGASLIAGAVAGVASFLCQAAELPPPRELMLIMSVLASTEIPSELSEVVQRAALAAGGAAVAWLVTMSPALRNRRAPEMQAVTGALLAIADLLDSTGTDRQPAARHAAVLAARRAAISVERSGAGWEHRLSQIVSAAETLLTTALHAGVVTSKPLDSRWGTAVRKLATGVSTGKVPTPVLAGAPFGLEEAIGNVWSAVQGASVSPLLDPEERGSAAPGLLRQLRAAAHRQSVVVPTAVRIAIAVSLGVGIGSAIGVSHAYWVGLTAAAVLQASNLSLVLSRTGYRVAGTLIGVALVFALLGWNPPVLVVIAGVAVFQALVELVITANYGVAVIGITALALLLFHIGAPAEDVGTAIGATLIDTGIGAVLAVAVRYLLWPRATSARLPQVQARVLNEVQQVFRARWTLDGEAQIRRAAVAKRRQELQATLASLRAAQADALADTPRTSRNIDQRWPITHAIEDLAVIALSIPDDRPPPHTSEVQPFLDQLEQLGGVLTGDQAPVRDAGWLRTYPRTNAAVITLRAAVADLG